MSAPSSVRYLADTDDILCELKSFRYSLREQAMVAELYARWAGGLES